MRRLLVSVLAGLLAAAVAAAVPTAHAARAHPARTPLRPHPSSALALGLPGLDDLGGGDDEAGVRDAFPGSGVPRPPANLSPDVIVSQDRSAMPHNETSVAIDPRTPENVLVGFNDYSLGFGSSGFATSFDGGRTFYGGVLPLPSVTFSPPVPAPPRLPGPALPGSPVPKSPIALDGGGDPSVAFDRDGVAYYAEINFHRTGCVGGIFVMRSTNGGQTWSRPLFGDPPPGDTRRPGDGVVAVNADDHDCGIFYDKEYIATGPRPAGVAADPAADRDHISSDRLYVVFSEFGALPPLAVQPYSGPAVGTGSPTMLAYSDDQGRDWSTPVDVNGASASLCTAAVTGALTPPTPLPDPHPPFGLGLPPATPAVDACVDSQGAVPTVDPRSGAVYVTFFNGDNPLCADGQVLVVRSGDGGVTWGEPSQAACLATPLPTASEHACAQEPAGQEILSGYCFRVPTATQQSVTVDPLDGSVHVVYQDNRGGSDWEASRPGARPSDVDILTTSSTDGARTWGAAVRVNQDPPGDGRDQFFPWSAFGPDGTFYVSFLDRALDPGGGPPGASFQLLDPGGRLIGRSLAVSHDGGAHFTSRAISTGLFDGGLGFREGGFLGDYTGIAAGPLGSFTAWPDTRRAGAMVKGDNPLDMWSDIVGYASAPGSALPRVRVVAAFTRGEYSPRPVSGFAAAKPETTPQAAPAGARRADVLGGLVCGLVVMVGSLLGRRRRRT